MQNTQCEGLSPESSHPTKMDKNIALVKEKVFQKSQNMGVAVVRLRDLPTPDNKGVMLLSKRQKQWLQMPCHDVDTENPVQYKYLQDAARPSKETVEEEEDRAAVLKLSDQPILQPPTGIIEQIAKRKRTEHMQLAIQFEEELTSNSNALEDRVKLASEKASMKLSENAEEVEQVLSETYIPEKLHELKMKDLMELWSCVAEVLSLRNVIVSDLEGELHAIELERVQITQEILRRYATKLKKVAYLLPEQLDRLMEKEGIAVNLSIVANKKQYAKLYSLVLKESLAMEKDLRKKWEDMVDDWKDIVTANGQTEFNRFMSSRMVTKTDDEELLKDQFVTRLQEVERKRSEVLERMGTVSPPNINIEVLEKLKEELSSVYNEFNSVHSEYLLQLHSFLEGVEQRCEGKMDFIRKHLLDIEAYDSPSSYEFIMTEFLPQICDHMNRMRGKSSTLEKTLDSIFSEQNKKISEVFEFIRNLSLLWTSHVSDLESCRRELTVKLDEIRSAHDEVNQNLEANLDVVLDRLRQSATQETLERYMKESMNMLDTIRKGYYVFKTTMITEAETFPSTVQEFLDSYEVSLLQLLGVKHVIPTSAPARRISSSHSQSKQNLSSTVIRTSKGHTYVVMDEMPRKWSETEREDNSGSSKRRGQTEVQGQGGRARKDKVRFDTVSDGATVDEGGVVTDKGENERRTGERQEKKGKKKRASKDLGNKKGKGKRENKKAGAGGVEGGTHKAGAKRSKDGKEQNKQQNISEKEEKEEEDTTKGTFMTQDEEVEEDMVMVAVTLKDSAVQQVVHSIQLNFLEHLDAWRTSQIESATQMVMEKQEEMLTELDLRLHLHEPRPTRITKEIRDTRAAELIAHGERVNRHAEAIADALSDLKDAPVVIASKLEEEVVNFTAEIASITFSGVSNLKLLDKLREDTHKVFQKHMERVRAICEEYNSSHMAKFDVLGQSNAKYLASIKLFKDGGNYCPEEEEVFCRKLEKIGDKIRSSQLSTEASLGHTEEEYLTKSCDVMDEFKEVCDVYSEEFTFMSCWKKSVVSLHVLLKGEVAGSYSQAKHISSEIQAVDDAINKTRTKEITPAMLIAKISELFKLVEERTLYLQAGQTSEGTYDMHEEGDSTKKPISTINIIQSITGHHAATNASKLSALSADKRKRSTLKPPSHLVSLSDQNKDLSSKDSAQPKLNSHSSILSKHKSKKKSILEKFGHEVIAKDIPNMFLCNIKKILRAKVIELGKESENFYLVRSQNINGQQKVSHRQIKSSHVPYTIDIFFGLVEEEIDKHLSQIEEQRWKFIKELKLQCEEMTSVIMKVPDIVFMGLKENHCKAALTCWHEANARLTFGMDQINQKRVLLEKRLKPSFGRPDRSSALEELSIQEDKIYNETLKLVETFCMEAFKDLQTVFCDFLKDICETTKSLLILMDGATPAQKIKEDPSLPKPRPKMEDLVRKRVTENITEAARTCPTDFPTRHHKQDVVVKVAAEDVTIQTPRKVGEGVPSAMGTNKKKKSVVPKNLPSPSARPDIDSASLRTFKNNSYHWNQLPYNKAVEFLSPSRPGSKQSTVSSNLGTLEKTKDVSSPGSPLSCSMVLDIIKDVLQTRKSTKVHEMVIICRDKVFEKFVIQQREILRELESTEEECMEISNRSHQRWNTSIQQIKKLYTI